MSPALHRDRRRYAAPVLPAYRRPKRAKTSPATLVRATGGDAAIARPPKAMRGMVLGLALALLIWAAVALLVAALA